MNLILPNIDSEISLSPDDADEILNNNSFGDTNPDFLDNLPLLDRLKLINNNNNDNDDITVHTSEENPICGFAYSERNIYYIIPKLADMYAVKKLGKHSFEVTLIRGNEEANILQFIKGYVNPNLTYGIYYEEQI